MNPVIRIGFFSVHLYSICLMIAVIVGYTIIVRESVKRGFDKDDISDLMFYAILFGIIGARIYYCLFNLDYYLINPISIFKVWEGGLAIHGGIIAGYITILVYSRKKKYDLFSILDIIVIGLIVGQAIGRWGNFFNSEAHGPITSLSFLKKLCLPKFIINGMYIDGSYYIPTFLFESIWCFIGFIIMYFLKDKKYMKSGYLTSFYFIWYGIERLFVESLRTDSLMLFSFKVAQLVSILMIIIGVILFVLRRKKNE